MVLPYKWFYSTMSYEQIVLSTDGFLHRWIYLQMVLYTDSTDGLIHKWFYLQMVLSTDGFYLLLFVLDGFIEPEVVFHELLFKTHVTGFLFTSGVFPSISRYSCGDLSVSCTKCSESI